MTNDIKSKSSGIAFIKMPCKNHFEIFVKYGYEVTKLYASNSYKYDDCLKAIVIDGVVLSKIEEIVFSF